MSMMYYRENPAPYTAVAQNWVDEDGSPWGYTLHYLRSHHALCVDTLPPREGVGPEGEPFMVWIDKPTHLALQQAMRGGLPGLVFSGPGHLTCELEKIA
jgi:hypothetical protein